MVSSSSGAESIRTTRRWQLFAALTVVSVVLDQLTKWWAHGSLRAIGSKTIVHGYFDLRYALNPGAAWSFLRDADPSFRRTFFLAATVVAMGFILWMNARARMDQRLVRWALGLLFGGAIGNFIDRLRLGQVIDFISVHYQSHYYPTFNVADIAITVGVGLLLLDGYLQWRARRAGAGAASAPVAEPARPRPRRRKR